MGKYQILFSVMKITKAQFIDGLQEKNSKRTTERAERGTKRHQNTMYQFINTVPKTVPSVPHTNGTNGTKMERY